jgi:hypothetical protein
MGFLIRRPAASVSICYPAQKIPKIDHSKVKWNLQLHHVQEVMMAVV